MKKIMLVIFATGIFLSTPLFASKNLEISKEETQCELTFSLKSWSVFYKSGKGSGIVSCDNGQSADVKIRTHGGGVTFGKSEIVNGRGMFSKVHDINKLFGSYAQTEAHAGAKKSVAAQAMWNGNVGLTLSGQGKGWDFGFAFGKLKLTPK